MRSTICRKWGWCMPRPVSKIATFTPCPTYSLTIIISKERQHQPDKTSNQRCFSVLQRNHGAESWILFAAIISQSVMTNYTNRKTTLSLNSKNLKAPLYPISHSLSTPSSLVTWRISASSEWRLRDNNCLLGNAIVKRLLLETRFVWMDSFSNSIKTVELHADT